jgi:hypothetical protein
MLDTFYFRKHQAAHVISVLDTFYFRKHRAAHVISMLATFYFRKQLISRPNAVLLD